MSIALGIIGIALYAMAIALGVHFRRATLGFLAKHASIADVASLEEFKSLARHNMQAVYPFIVAILLGMALSTQLIIHDPTLGFVTFLILNGLVVWSGLSLQKVERRARELPCPDPALAATYRRIAQSWLDDAWPRF